MWEEGKKILKQDEDEDAKRDESKHFRNVTAPTTTRPTKITDKERKRMRRIPFLHLFESLFGLSWFSRVITSERKNENTPRFEFKNN